MFRGKRIISGIMLVLMLVLMLLVLLDVKRLPKQQHLHMRRMLPVI